MNGATGRLVTGAGARWLSGGWMVALGLALAACPRCVSSADNPGANPSNTSGADAAMRAVDAGRDAGAGDAAGASDAAMASDAANATDAAPGPDAAVRTDAGMAADASRPDASAPTDGSVVRVDAGPFPVATACDPVRGVHCNGDWNGNDPTTGQPFCQPACAATQCCSPQYGSFACVGRNADGGCPLPDIWVDTNQIGSNAFVQYDYFEPNHCAVQEGCVAAPGQRRLLRFDTWTPNTGLADVFLGQTPSDQSSTELFEWSQCHGHHHFNSYANYRLLDSDGGVAATGHKQAFCLEDFYRYPGRNRNGRQYFCDFQGIQRDWQDVYSSNLDCQWVDVTELDPGNYTLEISVNGEGILAESDYSNNVAVSAVTIPPPAGDVDVTEACPNGTRGLDRNCGWTRAGSSTCAPGQTVTVACSAACGAGSCTGDTIMRICGAGHDPTCTTRWLLAQNDDSACGNGSCAQGGDCCSRTAFTCPDDGQYVTFVGAYRADNAATCMPAEIPPAP